jgi:hypothetical protein
VVENTTTNNIHSKLHVLTLSTVPALLINNTNMPCCLHTYLHCHSTTAGLTYRSRLRALCAASLLAPRRLLGDVWGVQRGSGRGLARYAQTVGYMVELEAMRLPHALAEVLQCDREGLARAL